MSYTVVDNFNGGMDARKKRINGAPGTLFTLVNGHITRGGSIERRKKFVSTYALPAGNTFGLHAANNQLWVFGSLANPGTIPPGVNYQQLVAPAAPAMTGILKTENYSGLIYAIATYANGNIYHFYNGVRITSWDNVTAGLASNNAVASTLAALVNKQPGISGAAAGAVVTIAAVVPGVPYTISGSAIQISQTNVPTLTLVQTQANRVAVAEVLATGSFAVSLVGAAPGACSSVKVNGVEILGATVNYTTSDPTTAQAIAQQINSFSANYTAQAAGNIINITAVAGSGVTPNGYVVAATVTGNLVAQSFQNMHGGVNAVTALAQTYTATVGGTFDPLNQFSIVVNGVNSLVSGQGASMGTWAKTYKGKVYSPGQSLVFFSTNQNPTLFQDSGSSIGSGFINVSSQDTGSDTINAIEVYRGLLAFFARTNVQIWGVNADPVQNAFVSSIPSTGTRAPKSVKPFGNTDVFYLADAGVKSLRALDASGAAFANDVGAPIADHLLPYLATLSDGQVSAAASTLEPGSDRYWLAVGNRIYVFSYFPIYTAALGVYVPSGGVAAWSYYDTGALQFTDFARVFLNLYARAGDTIYLYGGATGATYPDAGADVCTVQLPFLTDKEPDTRKALKGFDIGCVGTWSVKLAVRPDDETQLINVGIMTGPSFDHGLERAGSQFTHVAPELTCNAAGYASISNLAVRWGEGHENR